MTTQRPMAVDVLWLVLRAATGLAQTEALRDDTWPRADFSRRTVELSEIESGGPPKDGIPAIDRPRFVAFDQADAWLDPREPVIAVELAGQARAYPLQILIYHEIVNDALAGRPIAVTFCPLCNASIVFERRVENQVLDFGTTGKLRKSDLVMYDRQTESWWQQFSGKGIVGKFAGTVLRQMPSHIVSYADFKRAHPGAEILSRATGYSRPYGRNPYRGYDRIGDTPFLFRDPVDPRLPAMERVIGVSVGARQRIYPFSLFDKQPVINDELAGIPLVVFSQSGTLSVLDAAQIKDSRTVPSATAFDRRLGDRIMHFAVRGGKILDMATRSEWNLVGRAVNGKLKGRLLRPVASGVHFAFAWLAFNPDSEIHGLTKD